ncbi:unnamed protein product [Vitrella brassicaformis CCMP3155]|uniref:Uncharacterized protein n=1 Tax=Vitrella brassicaformis (strain CCMP3155) TaxID=1169540 RepID=A0A0G4G4Z3_VITBC|nr:unnamed protein product [Vitrella brassicaformis CCMP3155]|eukprot:CEM23390.1 unnamed protein product [Vitrella brassicaformis CCMP3155]
MKLSGVRLNPVSGYLNHWLAGSHLYLGDLPRASRCAETATACMPASEPAWVRRAAVLIRMRRYDDATAALMEGRKRLRDGDSKAPMMEELMPMVSALQDTPSLTERRDRLFLIKPKALSKRQKQIHQAYQRFVSLENNYFQTARAAAPGIKLDVQRMLACRGDFLFVLLGMKACTIIGQNHPRSMADVVEEVFLPMLDEMSADKDRGVGIEGVQLDMHRVTSTVKSTAAFVSFERCWVLSNRQHPLYPLVRHVFFRRSPSLLVPEEVIALLLDHPSITLRRYPMWHRQDSRLMRMAYVCPATGFYHVSYLFPRAERRLADEHFRVYQKAAEPYVALEKRVTSFAGRIVKT